MWTLGFCLALALAFTASYAASCPKVKVQKDFDLEKFAGTWHIIEGTASVDSMKMKCVTWEIEHSGKKGKAGLLIKYISSITDKEKTEYWDMKTPKTSEPASMELWPLKGTLATRKSDLFVLYTDYETQAVVVKCVDLFLKAFQHVYILSRTSELDSKTMMSLYNLLKERDIDQKTLVPIAHDKCE